MKWITLKKSDDKPDRWSILIIEICSSITILLSAFAILSIVGWI